MNFSELPLDVLHPILAHVSDRRGWHTCALVNRVFNQISTPLLYRNLDSRVKNGKLYHPSQTILLRPELAKYVRDVTETGAVHFTHRQAQPSITRDTVQALSLCINLRSLTWIDDCASFSLPYLALDPRLGPHPTRQHQLTEPLEQHPLLSLLSGITSSKAPLHELVIRSNSDLGSHVWSELSHWTRLTKIIIWCMEGPPRVLQGWAGKELGKTLRTLEIGRCAGVPPTILISVFSQLPLLQDLHIKGVHAPTVLTILTLLPDLQTLDTEYLNSGSGNIWPRDWPLRRLLDSPLDSSSSSSSSSPASTRIPQLPTLRSLTVRTSSIDSMGPNKLFPWIRALSTNPGLESFRLHTFTTNGYPSIPRGFILEMARLHNAYLRKWIVPTMEMMLSDIECVCTTFGGLEEVACSTAVVVGDVDSIKHAIASAKNLHTLRLHVQWIPNASSQHESRRLTPSMSSRSPFGHGMTDSDADRYYNTDTAADLDSDTETVPQRPNFFRFSSDTGGRGAFEFDQIGLQYASSSNFFRYGVDRFGVFDYGKSGGGGGGLDYDASDGIEDSFEVRRGVPLGGAKNDDDEITARGKGRGKSYSCRWPFTLEHAKDMMLSDESKLRVVAVGGVVYTGKWVWGGEGKDGGGRRFEVEDVEEE